MCLLLGGGDVKIIFLCSYSGNTLKVSVLIKQLFKDKALHTLISLNLAVNYLCKFPQDIVHKMFLV